MNLRDFWTRNRQDSDKLRRARRLGGLAMVSYGCTFGIYWLLKAWGDAALTEPVAVAPWLILYRHPTSGFEIFLWFVYLFAEASIGALIYRSRSRSEAVVLGIMLGGLVGGNVSRLIDAEIDYASVDVGGGRWLDATFPDAAFLLGAMLLAMVWIRRHLVNA